MVFCSYEHLLSYLFYIFNQLQFVENVLIWSNWSFLISYTYLWLAHGGKRFNPDVPLSNNSLQAIFHLFQPKYLTSISITGDFMLLIDLASFKWNKHVTVYFKDW